MDTFGLGEIHGREALDLLDSLKTLKGKITFWADKRITVDVTSHIGKILLNHMIAQSKRGYPIVPDEANKIDPRSAKFEIDMIGFEL
jgi:hypothetical protein